MTNKLVNIIILLVIIQPILSIDQTCSRQDCPNNSQCSISIGYCVCDNDYILDCNTPSTQLTSNFRQFNITTNPSYYTSTPSNLDTYYYFVYTLCSNQDISNALLVLSLWSDDGQNQLTSNNNFLGSDSINARKLSRSQQCLQVYTPTFRFGSQPNGNSQALILQLSLEAQRNRQLSNTTIFQMTIKSQQIQIADSNILFLLSIIAVGAILFVLFIAVMYCVFKKCRSNQSSRLKMSYQKRMIDSFKQQTPQILFKNVQFIEVTNCTVCLADFSQNQKVRHLVCGHIFHSNCIDTWCLKNLSCPVCRFQLDQTSIELKKKQKQNRSFDGVPINVELQNVSQRINTDRSHASIIRQSLIQPNQF